MKSYELVVDSLYSYSGNDIVFSVIKNDEDVSFLNYLTINEILDFLRNVEDLQSEFRLSLSEQLTGLILEEFKEGLNGVSYSTSHEVRQQEYFSFYRKMEEVEVYLKNIVEMIEFADLEEYDYDKSYNELFVI